MGRMTVATKTCAGALALGGLLIAVGCSTTAANVTEVQTEPFGTQVLVGDPDLYEQMHVVIEDVLTKRNADGFLEAQVTIFNQSSGTIRFEYAFQWFDKDGFKVKDAIDHWTPEQIYGRQKLPIQAVSPNPEATSFKVAVRRPQEQK